MRTPAQFIIAILVCSSLTYGRGFFNDLVGSPEVTTEPLNGPNPHIEQLHSPFPCSRVIKGSSDEIQLIDLSNPSTLEKVEDLESRLAEIRKIFATAGDRRGIFASIYHEVSKGALEAIQSGRFNQEEKVRRVIVEFGRTYFNGLNGHLKGARIKEEWAEYYAMTSDCATHPLKTCSTAMNTHIVLDLVDALILADVDYNFYDEYLALGDGLVEKIPNVAKSLADDFNVDYDEALGFFRGWLAGKGVNFGVDVVRKAINFLEDSDQEHQEWDAAGTFSMQWLRKGAWTDASKQVPWMVTPPKSGYALRIYDRRVRAARSRGPIKPDQSWWMTVKWNAYQKAFKVMAFFIDESATAGPRRID